ncbi:hypothetical protein [Ktedonospora formicarum]|uniref:hypothetical protein n=1 Tax=Ktedonospora formicarum TaxID=2778364 RepID=UPI001C68F6E0|nr:hypothetical protein [Ktedonospora formicarum]
MECCEPGAIRDEEIIAYLAGEKVRPVVKEHMEQCASCTARFAAYQRLEQVLTSKLYRWDCPSNQELGEYKLGLLNAEEEAQVQTHLGTCVLCAAEFQALSTFLEQDDLLIKPVAVPAMMANSHVVKERGAQLVDRLLEPVRVGIRRVAAILVPPQPSFYGVRGAAALWPKRYTAEDVSISLQLETNGTAQLVGFVSRKETSLSSLQGTPVVLLSRDERDTYTQQIDELGNFIFPHLAPKMYSLELHFSERCVVIEEVFITLDADEQA